MIDKSFCCILVGVVIDSGYRRENFCVVMMYNKRSTKTFCCIAVGVIVDLGTDSGICAVTFMFG